MHAQTSHQKLVPTPVSYAGEISCRIFVFFVFVGRETMTGAMWSSEIASCRMTYWELQKYGWEILKGFHVNILWYPVHNNIEEKW